MTRGLRCLAPPGRFRIASPILFDVNPARGTGLWIEGAGCARTVFAYVGATGPAFRLGTDTLVSMRGDNFYTVLSGVGFSGDVAGPLVQLGRDDFADAINGLELNQVCVNNARTTPSAEGVRVNSVVTSRLWMSVSMNYGGTACVLRGPSMTTFQGSCSGGDVGIAMTGDGYMFGNVFLNMDLEVNLRDVVINGPNTRRNTFLGGQYDFQIRSGPCAIDADAGASNVFENANVVGQAALCNATGVVLRGAGYGLTTPPMPPGNGTPIVNTTGQVVAVSIWGGTVQYVCVNGSCPTNPVLTSLTLAPGDAIGLAYTAAPVWLWRALP